MKATAYRQYLSSLPYVLSLTSAVSPNLGNNLHPSDSQTDLLPKFRIVSIFLVFYHSKQC